MLKLDFQNTLPPENTCLYSMWHGYLDRPDCTKCRAALEHLVCSFAEYHTSGHVFVQDCQKFVERIQPKCVVPIHTQAPEYFKALFKNVRLLKDGETLTIDHG